MAGGCELEPDPGFEFCDLCGECGAGYHVCECDEECMGSYCPGEDAQAEPEDERWQYRPGADTGASPSYSPVITPSDSSVGSESERGSDPPSREGSSSGSSGAATPPARQHFACVCKGKRGRRLEAAPLEAVQAAEQAGAPVSWAEAQPWGAWRPPAVFMAGTYADLRGAAPQWQGREAGKGGARGEPLDEVMERLGLNETLGARLPDEWFGGSSTAGERQLMEDLRASRDRRVEAITDTSRLRTALERFDSFLERTRRVPFVDPARAGGRRYNQDTLDAFREDVRERGSIARGHEGEAIRGDTVEAMVSAIKTLRCRKELHDVFGAEYQDAARVAAKHMRREDGPSGQRRLCRGLRAHHFRELEAQGYDRSSRRGMVHWAAALLAWNILLRGGELGFPTGGAFNGTRHLTWASFEWRAPCAESKGLPWLIVWVVPIKDQVARAQAVPMAVRRLAGYHEQGEMALDTYDAVRRVWDAGVDEVPASERTVGQPSSTPFFTNGEGLPWSTTDTRRLGTEMGARVGIPAAECGAKMFRIGGATEVRVLLGVGGATALIKERGRWASDIGMIYSRALVGDHLDASAAMAQGGVEKRALEDVCAGWIQPATFR